MKYFNVGNIRLVLMIVLVTFLFAFTSKRNSERKLTRSEVVFTKNDDLFIEHESVNKLLIENKSAISAIQKEQVDLDKLEQLVSSHQMVEKSEVFLGIDGVLKAVVEQKEPIVRVFDQSGSFYLDYEGNKMPLSAIHAARVPLFSGEIDADNKQALTDLFRQIHDDEFLKKNIIGMALSTSGNIIMMNRNYNYEIDFGKTINVKSKFKNYKAFFQKASQDSTLYRYRKINLKFTQQVVCTK